MQRLVETHKWGKSLRMTLNAKENHCTRIHLKFAIKETGN